MTVIQTKVPKRVIQVFKNYTTYGKKQNNHKSREELTRWNDFVPSTTGHVVGNRMLLNSKILKEASKFEACDTLILTDYNSGLNDREQEYFFLQKRSKLGYDIFTLNWAEDGYEVFLDYTRHAYSIGVPRRADYKIANLKQQMPLRVSINGKHDRLMFGSPQARTYSVADYYFILLGAFSEFEFLDDDEVMHLKPIGNIPAKHVDLREILY